MLATYGIQTQTPHQIEPVQIWPPSELVKAYEQLGVNEKLGLSGRPPRPIGGLGTAKVCFMRIRFHKFISYSVNNLMFLFCNSMFFLSITFLISQFLIHCFFNSMVSYPLVFFKFYILSRFTVVCRCIVRVAIRSSAIHCCLRCQTSILHKT